MTTSAHIQQRRAAQQESRIAELEREFAHDPDFIFEAIAKWWTVEQARAEYQRRKEAR